MCSFHAPIAGRPNPCARFFCSFVPGVCRSAFLGGAGAGSFFWHVARREVPARCRARLTDRRDGAGRFARRPAAAQYERPVKSPAGFVARRLTGRGAARPSTRFRLCVLARVRTAAAARELIALVAVRVERGSTPATLLGLLVVSQQARTRVVTGPIAPAKQSFCRAR